MILAAGASELYDFGSSHRPGSTLKNTAEQDKNLSERELIFAMKAGIAAVERGDYRQGYKSLQVAYGHPKLIPPPDGLSHYGLCIAIMERQTRKGAELCRDAINQQFYDPAHFVNLVRLYIIRGNRKNAIDVLHEGLSRLPEDRKLLALREEIGYRSKPVVPFLDRNNPVNAALGKLRAAKAQPKAVAKPRPR